MTLTLPPTFTEAHRRALEWLPEDGSVGMHPARLGQALHRLAKAHPLLIDGWHDRRDDAYRWRLTPAGIVLVKKAQGK